MADEFRVCQPREFYRRYLEQDLRPDHRELGEARNVVINTGSITTAEGSALVRVGSTTVLCGIKAELVEPTAEEPDAGFIVPNVDLPPLCSPAFRPGPPSEQAQALSQYLLNVLDSTRCIDKKDLCIKAGRLVWVLYCDVVCLSYDGNVTDAALISLLAALLTASLPKVTLDENDAEITCDEAVRQKLAVRSRPVPLTFSLFDKQLLIVDPTAEEEQLENGCATAVSLDDGSFCCVHMPGGGILSPEQIQLMMKRTAERADQVRSLLPSCTAAAASAAASS